ncbi:MAG: carbon starvation protein A [Ignavibacteria bacterium]|nr:carbon starvation protein A [Ignavibacteria bacterium]
MNIAIVMIGSLIVLIVGYRTYGRFVAKKIGVDPDVPTPAVTKNDGIDYVPTKPLILFGHHFAAIAAAGPIVGPTLAILFGYLPAWLWIIVGVIFIGAVHDFTSLFVAMREGGKSIAEVAKRTLGKQGFLFYVSFAIILCLLVIAAFLQLTAVALTSSLPPDDVNLTAGESVLHTIEISGILNIQIGGVASASVIIMTVVAPLIGWMIYKKQINVVIVSIIAFTVAFASVVIGFYYPVTLDPKVWMIIISVYVFFASWIPVWLILQPRDFVNAQILYLGLASMVIGIIAAGFNGAVINVPVSNISGAMEMPNLGLIWPFLFVTIACGAASGAHGLICGGTSCKQISSEKHAKMIGYGGMLLEGLLAVCVTLIIAGGLDFEKYKSLVYPAENPLRGNPPLAFALGLGNILNYGIGLPTVYGTIWGILLLEGFLITTIDALVRLTRYLFEELWSTFFTNPPKILMSKAFNSLIVVSFMVLLAFTNAYASIWPVFGSANQLLAALTLIAVTAWLVQKAKNYWFTAIPAGFMVITTLFSLVILLERYISASNWTLTIADTLLLILAIGVVILSFKYFYNMRVKLSTEANKN